MDARLQSQCIAVLGTGSDVGKSIVCAALCRILKRAGISAAPFKAQNMSNNSFVTVLGGEMGRAQVVQAEAAGIEPHVDMNPVLLKPSTDTGAQVVLQGRAMGNASASGYWADTSLLYEKARESLDRLRERYKVIVMEGAGSCAEINLMERDFVNFRIAAYAGAPVILVADIDRGGVFAQIIGTLEILPEPYRRMVRGIIINRFRGEAALFRDGIEYIERKTNLPVLGLIPYFYDIEIDSEDGVVLEIGAKAPATLTAGTVKIGVLKLPHISNFTDFNPLQRDRSVDFTYLYRPEPLDGYDLVILPGTKNVRFDLDWLRETGWAERIAAYAARGGAVCGICGGFQMLGARILDPEGIEGPPGETGGLRLLDTDTVLHREKTLCRVEGVWRETGARFCGYEIHMGRTAVPPGLHAPLEISMRNGERAAAADGAASACGKIWGFYVHGFFDEPDCLRALLQKLKPGSALRDYDAVEESPARFKERQYDMLAAHFRRHLRMHVLENIIGIPLAGGAE